MPILIPITVAFGDGIGPEIMAATLKILESSGAPLQFDFIEVGEQMYLDGFTSGIPDSAWESLRKNRVLLKGPITTPQGGGYKSLNVTLRKTMGLFANVRPSISYKPYIPTLYPNINLVIIRENEEGTYAGIEHRQTEDFYQCLKIVTRTGCEKIINYAFEYALKFNRKKVTCMTKDNIMKMTDGIFHQVFNEIAPNYPDIETEHYIIDIGTALVATEPERFDVIVTSNLYGDILSDVAAQVAGSVGVAGSANIGTNMAMFEAIHGSAPDIAGKNMANPSGLIHAAIQMLIHINQPYYATLIENAWLKTIEDGIHTGEIFSEAYSKEKVGTDEFAEAVIERLDEEPSILQPVDYDKEVRPTIVCYDEIKKPTSKKELVGVDIFLDNPNYTAEQLAEKITKINSNMQLIVITSRGLKIWPNSMIETPYIQQCCCRFQSSSDIKKLPAITHHNIIDLLEHFDKLGLDVIKTENLYTFDGKPGFTLAQGQ